MDISGPIRNILRQTLGDTPSGEVQGPLEVFVQMVAFGDYSPGVSPRFFAEGGVPILQLAVEDSAGQVREVYRQLALAGLMRVLPRVTRALREEWAEALRQQTRTLVEEGQKLLVNRTTRPVQFLWQHWLLQLARERLRVEVRADLLMGLWRRGFGAQARGGEGHLHPLTAETSLDGFVFDELCALHAAYNALSFLARPDWLGPVEKLVQWHVANTQPDNTTQQPWGLAAFASLDASGTFAQQQLHDATLALRGAREGGAAAGGGRQDACTTKRPERMQIGLALLADALLTQEDAAERSAVSFGEF